ANFGFHTSRAAVMRLANLHFKVDDLPDPQMAVFRLLGVFQRMKAVLLRPGGTWGPANFDWDPKSDVAEHNTWFAYTYAGGANRAGEKTGDVRMDMIYMCPVLDTTTDDGIIQTIIHEMAHFVGAKSGAEEITDHAYGQVDGVKMSALSALKRTHNAESIGNFAFEAKYGRKPAYS